MPSITVTKVVKTPEGKVFVAFGKEIIEFASIADAQSWADDVLSRRSLKAIAIALMLTRQPNLGNPSVFENRSVVVDFGINNWGQVT